MAAQNPTANPANSLKDVFNAPENNGFPPARPWKSATNDDWLQSL